MESTENKKKTHLADQDLSFKELFGFIKKVSKELRNRINFLILILIVAFLIVFLQNRNHVNTYPGVLTFMINEEGSTGSLVSGILGQFGLGSSGGKYNLEKINYLVKSNRIQRDALLDSANINSKDDILINHLIDIYNLDGKIGIEKISSNENERINQKTLKECYEFLIENKIINCKLDDLTGIFSIETTTVSEELSINLANKIYKALSSFYIKQSTDRQKVAHDVMKAKVDSIEDQLSRVNYSIAAQKDKFGSTWSNRSNVALETLQQERMKLVSIYTEAMKNYEISSFTLSSQTPVFQVVDEPLKPIEPKTFNMFKTIIVAVFLSLFIYLFIVLVLKFVKENT